MDKQENNDTTPKSEENYEIPEAPSPSKENQGYQASAFSISVEKNSSPYTPPPPGYNPQQPSNYYAPPAASQQSPTTYPPYTNPYGYMPQTSPYSNQPPQNKMALASMIVSLSGIVLTMFIGIGFLASIVGIVLGHISLSDIKRTGKTGKGFALTGIIAGYAWVTLTLLFGGLLLLIYILSYSAVYSGYSGY